MEGVSWEQRPENLMMILSDSCCKALIQTLPLLVGSSFALLSMIPMALCMVACDGIPSRQALVFFLALTTFFALIGVALGSRVLRRTTIIVSRR